MDDAGVVTSQSPNGETAEPLGILLAHLELSDLGAARTAPAELDHRLDRVGPSLEGRLDGAVVAIRDPTGDTQRFCPPARGVPEEDALDPPPGDDAPSDRAQ